MFYIRIRKKMKKKRKKGSIKHARLERGRGSIKNHIPIVAKGWGGGFKNAKKTSPLKNKTLNIRSFYKHL